MQTTLSFITGLKRGLLLVSLVGLGISLGGLNEAADVPDSGALLVDWNESGLPPEFPVQDLNSTTYVKPEPELGLESALNTMTGTLGNLQELIAADPMGLEVSQESAEAKLLEAQARIASLEALLAVTNGELADWCGYSNNLEAQRNNLQKEVDGFGVQNHGLNEAKDSLAWANDLVGCAYGQARYYWDLATALKVENDDLKVQMAELAVELEKLEDDYIRVQKIALCSTVIVGGVAVILCGLLVAGAAGASVAVLGLKIGVGSVYVGAGAVTCGAGGFGALLTCLDWI